MHNFWQLPLHEFPKFMNILWVCWFLGKNHSNFLSLIWNSTSHFTILCTAQTQLIVDLRPALVRSKHYPTLPTDMGKKPPCYRAAGMSKILVGISLCICLQFSRINVGIFQNLMGTRFHVPITSDGPILRRL
jgi:hypothetical protein